MTVYIGKPGKNNDRIYREGAPVDIIGKVGQKYIDVTNNDIYICTSKGEWLKIISDGKIVAEGLDIEGEGAPTSSIEASVSQKYIDTLTGDIYECVSNAGGSTVWNLLYKYADGKWNLVDKNGDIIDVSLKVDKADIDTSMPSTASDEKVPSTKLLKDEVDKKASIEDLENGIVVPDKANLANNLTPYSEESGETQEEPFILEGTGTANGTNIVDTGSYAKYLSKKSNVVCYNQRIQNRNMATDASNWAVSNYTITDFSANGYKTIVNTASGQAYLSQQKSVKVGHKYLFIYDAYCVRGDGEEKVYPTTNLGNAPSKQLPTTKGTLTTFIFEATTGMTWVTARLYSYGSGYTIYFKDVIMIDLTQWFNGDIPADLMSHPENFYRYYQGSLDYNVGTLIDSNAQIIKSIGRNAFMGNDTSNSQYIGNYYINDQSNYDKQANSNYNCYRISVIPNRKYFLGRTTGSNLAANGVIRFVDKDYNLIKGDSSGYGYKYVILTTPANCLYIEMCVYNTTGMTALDLELAYFKDQAETTLEDGYLDNGTPIHYSYEVLDEIDTGSEQLLAFDVKPPTGVIERNTGNVNLSTLSWTHVNTQYANYYWATVSDAKLSASGTNKPNIKADKYIADTPNNVTSVSNNAPLITVDNTNHRILVNGNYLGNNTPTGNCQYELDDVSKTTEQGTSYKEIMDIDDFGSIEVSTPTGITFNGVPMGNAIFYPVDYKATLDSLYNYVEGDVSNLALKSELTEYVKQVDLTSQITDVAGLTYTYKKLIKIGKVFTLCITAQNNTGESIVSSATLFTLASGTFTPTRYIIDYIDVNGVSKRFRIDGSGYAAVNSAIAISEVIAINLTYIVD